MHQAVGDEILICPSVLEPKLFNNNHLQDGIPARGGLEPRFRVLFSAIFHGFPSEIAIRVENGGF